MNRILSYSQAIREATQQEMARDSSVILMGLGVSDAKGLLGTTQGLIERFGPERVIETPLSEDAMTGAAIGAALAGLRPIHTHVRMEFLMLAMSQIVNIASKARYMYGGAVKVPMVIRVMIGEGWGAQHSQGLHSFFMHLPGLKVIAPTTPYEAKGGLIAAIRDNNPVIFVEHFKLYAQRGPVPERPYSIPLGRAVVRQRGSDITMVGISAMVPECLRAAEYLKTAGISAEVIDPISLSPLDTATISASVKKTGKLLVADSAWVSCGASAEIVSRVSEALAGRKAVKFKRLGFAPVPCPTSAALERRYYPNAQSIAAEAYRLARDSRRRRFTRGPQGGDGPRTQERV